LIAIIRKIVEIIIYGNVWISLGAAALSLNTFLIMSWEINMSLVLLVFFATLLSYSFQRVVRHQNNDAINSSRHQWVYNQKYFLYGQILLSSAICGYLFFTIFTFYDLINFSPLIAIALFYAVKMFSKSLRDISFLKILLIAVSWASVTVLIPAYINQNEFEQDIWVLFTLNFLYIFALVIPFDIRDLDFDEADKKTIPQLMGVKPAKIMAALIIALCGVLSMIFLANGVQLLPVYILSIIVMLLVNKKRKEFYYAFGIDGLILLFPVSTWIVKSYF